MDYSIKNRNDSFAKHESKGIVYYTSRLFDEKKVPHIFCTRLGGVSKGAFESLNVSTARRDENGRTDNLESVYENYRRALSILSVLPENAAAAHQVHSNIIYSVNSFDGGRGIMAGKGILPEADGIFVSNCVSGISAAAVKTADCVPILLYNTESDDFIALHAGWRGTVANICKNAVDELSKSGKKESIIVAIGPCIGQCCYEVSENIYFAAKEAVLSGGGKTDDLFKAFSSEYYVDGNKKYKASLSQLNKILLMLCGILPENISVAKLCTSCTKQYNGKALFFSHRASGGFSGTFISAIARRKV